MKSIFTEVSEMAQKINSMGKPQEGVAYIIAAVDTKEEGKPNTSIALAGKGIDVLTLVDRLLDDDAFGSMVKRLQTMRALDHLKDILGDKLSDAPKDADANASKTKLS